METNHEAVVTEVVYRGFLCKRVGDEGWKIIMGDAEYLFPSLTDAKLAINGLHEDCVKKYWGAKIKASVPAQNHQITKVEKTHTVQRKEKKRNPFISAFAIALIVLFALIILGASTSSTGTPAATSTPTKKAVVTATPTKTPFISATPKRTKKATVKPTSTAAPTATPTNTPVPTPEETAFAVEHDAEYYATQEYIYKFLTEKGYEVQVTIGVPNIGRYEDAVPTDAYVNWYAYIKRNGKWQEFVVVLFNGEVSAIRPVK